ncbi:MAG: hypothetical protein LBR60_06220 [Fibrobacter sp.]|jgi:hypothetical protein|nr:hypothetical protein [Fibrobacter sp.]
MANSQTVEIDVSSDESFVREIKPFLSEMLLAAGVSRLFVDEVEKEIEGLFCLVFEKPDSGILHLEYHLTTSELTLSLSDEQGTSYGMRKTFDE